MWRVRSQAPVFVPVVTCAACAGLEAVDYFMPGYHVWAKVIEALADVGYDTNNLARLPS